MLSRITIVILLLAILGQTFYRVFIVTSYYANTDTYAKNCVNKVKPSLHCNGKCQMMKKMKQEENKDKQTPERRNNNEEVLSSKSFFISVQAVSACKLIHAVGYTSSFPENRNTEFFHPPQS
jgi:hypothetical protein